MCIIQDHYSIPEKPSRRRRRQPPPPIFTQGGGNVKGKET
jgi:hypothetical protein